MRKIIIIICTLLLTYGIRADIEYGTTNLTTSNGLSNNTVRNIFQDSRGFIWFSTPNGLNCYDGNSFIVYRPGTGDGLSLADQRINGVKEDGNGHLWISSSANIYSCYDLNRDCFIDFTGKNRQTAKYRASTVFGNAVWLWGAATGCLKCDVGESELHSSDFSESRLSSLFVTCMTQCGDALWIGTEKGLFKWESDRLSDINDRIYFVNGCAVGGTPYFISNKGVIYSYRSGKLSKTATVDGIDSHSDITGLMLDGATWYIFTTSGCTMVNLKTGVTTASVLLQKPGCRVYEDNRSNSWIYDGQGTLTYFNRKKHSFRDFEIFPPEMVKLVDEGFCICHDSRDIIWIATHGNGLFAYNTANDEVKHYTTETSDIQLTTNSLKFIYEDRSGSLWIGNDMTGITHLRPIQNNGVYYLYPAPGEPILTRNNCVRLIYRSVKGEIIVGNRNGYTYSYTMDLKHQNYMFTEGINSYCAALDRDNLRWVGSKGGGLYAREHWYTHDEGDESSISFDEIYALQMDNKGRMWVGTFGGGLDLAIIDKAKGLRFRHFFVTDDGTNKIRAMCIDKNGNIWAATSNGVVIFNPDHLVKDPDRFFRLNTANGKLRSDEIRSIYCDSKGNIYIAETGEGIAVCSPQHNYSNLIIQHYDVTDGMANTMVQAFAEDRLGNIWISTEYGISRFNTEKRNFENYFFSKNMLSNVFNENSATLTDGGQLLFGTNNGILVLDPMKFQKEADKDEVFFSNLKINGLPLRHDMEMPSDGPALINAQSVGLDYNLSSFEIYFATFDYASMVKPKYTYWLEGYDNDWSTPSELNFATYKNLKPGSYTLHVKACNAAGKWSEEKVLKINVEHPLWLRWWAICLYIITAVAIWYFIKREHRRTKFMKSTISTLTTQKDNLRKLFTDNIKENCETEDGDRIFMEKVERIAEEELQNPDFSADDFASRMNQGRTIFFAEMKRVTGYSPKEFIKIKRLRKAAEYLVTTDHTISEVAFLVGINDPYYFSRCFKEQFSMSPSVYRNQAKEETGQR